MKTLLTSILATSCVLGAWAETAVMWVDAASESAAEPYATRSTAAATIGAAITAAKAWITDNGGDVEIRICDGTYTETGFTLDKAIAVVGDSGDPAKVEIVDAVNGSRAFTMSHANARVEAVTVSGTGVNISTTGGHINMSNGRLVNCIITGGRSNTHGGNIYATAGRIIRCKVLNGYIAGGHGGGIYASGAQVMIESCLIKGNSGGSSNAFVAGLELNGGATAIHCTVVGNTGTKIVFNSDRYPRGLRVNNYCKAINCIIYNNGGTWESEFGTANRDKYYNCASSVTNEYSASWHLVGSDDFVDTVDYRLTPSSRAIDVGTDVYASMLTDEVDLDGSARLSNGDYDIGCYEYDQSVFSFGGRPDAYAAFEGSNVCFSAKARGAANPWYKWDFGNGDTVVTQAEDIVYAYPASGLYTVRLSASPDGEHWEEWQEMYSTVRIAPATIYVGPDSETPAFPYSTKATACHSLSEVFNILTNGASGGKIALPGVTVRMLAGTYNETGIVLDRAISIVGDTGNPEDVEIVDAVNGSRAFTISHADARVEAIKISGNGWGNTACNGGHVNMSAGTVDRCIITGGHCQGHGGNVLISGGSLLRSQILNGYITGSGKHGCGIYAEGSAYIAGCYVKGNSGGSGTYTGGIEARGSTKIVNCTVVNNSTYTLSASGTDWAGGVCICDKTVKVINTVAYGNNGSSALNYNWGNKNLDCSFNCAATATNASCATWTVLNAADDFVDAANGDYHLKPGSRLRDAGTDSDLGALPYYDLEGNLRLSGSAYDIGCYEYDQSKFSFGGYLQSYAVHEGEAITFVSSSTGVASPKFKWDFGNSVEYITTEEEFEYVYPASGHYTVRLSASSDGGMTWADWMTVETRPVVVPAVMYVGGSSENPVFPYATPATAANSFDDAWAATTNNASAGKPAIGGITIYVLPGAPMTCASGYVLERDIRIIGTSGNPEDAELYCSVAGRRSFTLTHASAKISGITISGRGSAASMQGGHINMSNGLIEDSIITGGCANSHGGNIYMSGGRVSRCRILNGEVTGSGSHGSGVYATGGVVENSLIRGNFGHNNTYSAGAEMNGGKLVNCNVIGNYGSAVVFNTQRYGRGVTMTGNSSVIVNTLIYGNGDTVDNEIGNYNFAHFYNCASSITNSSCATWKVITSADMRDYTRASAGDLSGYRPRGFAPNGLYETGTTWTEYDGYGARSETDLLGHRRLTGRRLDIGCLESLGPGGVMRVK